MSQYSSRGIGYSVTAPTETMMLIREKLSPTDGTYHGILCFHGHAGDSSQFEPFGQSTITAPGYHTWQLAEAGYLMGSIDAGGGTAWSNSAAMDRATDGYNWLTGTAGAKTGKIGLMGWSMGGMTALNWAKRNPTLVAGVLLWAPATDLDYFHSTSGYTPAYGSALPNNAGWTSEIDASYGSPYATTSTGYRIRDEYSSWAGLGIPIRVIHASDDTTIPVAQSQNGFVPGVNDANVTLRTPLPTGNHTGLFANVPSSETVAFFNGLTWT